MEDDFGSREVTERLLNTRMKDDFYRLSFGRWDEVIEPNFLRASEDKRLPLFILFREINLLK